MCSVVMVGGGFFSVSEFVHWFVYIHLAGELRGNCIRHYSRSNSFFVVFFLCFLLFLP